MMRYRGMNGNATSYALNVPNWEGSFVWCDRRGGSPWQFPPSVPSALCFFLCRRNFTADDRSNCAPVPVIGTHQWQEPCPNPRHSSPSRWNGPRDGRPRVKSHIWDFDRSQWQRLMDRSSLCRNFYVSFFHLLFYGVRYSVSRNLSGKGSIYFLSISNEISSELLGWWISKFRLF